MHKTTILQSIDRSFIQLCAGRIGHAHERVDGRPFRAWIAKLFHVYSVIATYPPFDDYYPKHFPNKHRIDSCLPDPNDFLYKMLISSFTVTSDPRVAWRALSSIATSRKAIAETITATLATPRRPPPTDRLPSSIPSITAHHHYR